MVTDELPQITCQIFNTAASENSLHPNTPEGPRAETEADVSPSYALCVFPPPPPKKKDGFEL